MLKLLQTLLHKNSSSSSSKEKKKKNYYIKHTNCCGNKYDLMW